AGGIITAAKKIRTRNGEHMMFATLDDLEGSVEILVFGKALAEYEGALGVDSVVVVRGRVDHKDADKTCLVVQSAEPFAPTPDEVERARETALTRKVGPEPLHVRVDAAGLPDTAISDLKHVLANFPGESEVVLEFHLRSRDPLTLKLGPSYRVAPTPTLRAELEHVLGPAALIAV
ncbi:MAG TPA: OB-fold nucleic acid binding domain-containing protein, partial [Solirubrobacteraceae bacterium]|nr:OB-fold nucleic acid binding domain-containing protein [Solirubrobacteraceae bacterium]